MPAKRLQVSRKEQGLKCNMPVYGITDRHGFEFLYETRDKIQETRGRRACGAHFDPALFATLVSLFVVGRSLAADMSGRPVAVIQNCFLRQYL